MSLIRPSSSFRLYPSGLLSLSLTFHSLMVLSVTGRAVSRSEKEVALTIAADNLQTSGYKSNKYRGGLIMTDCATRTIITGNPDENLMHCSRKLGTQYVNWGHNTDDLVWFGDNQISFINTMLATILSKITYLHCLKMDIIAI